MTSRRSPYNFKKRSSGDRKVISECEIDDLIQLFLCSIKLSNGDNLSEHEIRNLENTMFVIIRNSRPYYRTRKNHIKEDIKIPKLTGNENSISLSEAVKLLKSHSNTWENVIRNR